MRGLFQLQKLRLSRSAPTFLLATDESPAPYATDDPVLFRGRCLLGFFFLDYVFHFCFRL